MQETRRVKSCPVQRMQHRSFVDPAQNHDITVRDRLAQKVETALMRDPVVIVVIPRHPHRVGQTACRNAIGPDEGISVIVHAELTWARK